MQCKTRALIHPIIDWTEKDVWEYIDERKLPYPSLYEEEGIGRIGCIGCPMAGSKGQANSFERWPKYKGAYIRAFQRMVDKRKRDGLKTAWNTGQEVFDWWLTPPKIKRSAP
jgi:phosphoadenosine phosphosulfate reductase